MKVYVQGHRGAGFGGKFIKWFTFGGFSHVSLVFIRANGNPILIESIQGKGVHYKPYKPSDASVMYRVECSSEQAVTALNEAVRLIGCKYDWAGIWGFLRRKKKHNPNKWFCSELVAHCLLKADIELMRLPPWKQSPVMICSSMSIQIDEEMK